MLTEEIQNVDENRIETKINIERKDEVGILIRSYNHMIKRIQDLIQENYETRIAQKEFEMKALQAQINPHFLYNSLSIINWKAIEAGEEEISNITLALSSFYRTTLNKGNTMIDRFPLLHRRCAGYGPFRQSLHQRHCQQRQWLP